MQVPELVANSTTGDNGQPSHITVQHILIGFDGSVPGKNISRNQDEARQLAGEILSQARSGENFKKLVEQNTDDSAPGIYHMANFGAQSDMYAADDADKVFPRDGMVPAFGDTGFPLEVGEIGMSEYHAQKSPFGWHIVKRLR
ncbi:MAG: peptidylprolyl isomerase [Pirellulaceae bacterium]